MKEREVRMRILRVGLYERVSTMEQSIKGYSIETQKSNLEEYAKKNNMKIVGHYTDEGISGAKPPLKRPDLKRLLEDVEAGKIDMILFTKLDRWFRSVKEYFKVQDILDTYGVQWKAIHENYDTTTANGQMAITIFLAVAQNERDRTAERIKVVLEHKRKNKEACFGGNAVPLGYIKEEDENGVMRLVKDPETKQAVQEFWDIMLEYNNLNKAIRHMGNVYGIHKDWKSWMRMTRSDFYCGVHRDIQDYCEPYVTPEDFLKLLEKRPQKATPTGRTYMFRGLIRCPECGNKLCGDADTRRSKVYKTYRCAYRSRGCENSSSYSELKMEKNMLKDLDKHLRNAIIKAEIELTKPKPKPTISVKSLKEKQRRLTVAYMAGNVSDEDYLKEDSELKALIAKAEQIAPPEPKDITPLKELLNTDFKSLYEGFTDEDKQAFWTRLIKEIKLDGRNISEVIFF